MKEVIAVAIAIFLVGCGSGEAKKPNARQIQKEYCKANGWIYEPKTNTCRVRRTP